MTIIGITGNKGNGKDTLADHLVENHGYVKICFANALKDACKILFGFTDEQLYGNLKEVIDENWGITPREIMQFVGTDLFRNQIKLLMPWINDNFWIECLKKKIKNMQLESANKNFVISDVRFKNEVDFINEMNGVIIRVKRHDVIINDTCQHESESNFDSFDVNYTIYNSGSLGDLYSSADNTMKLIELNICL